MSVKRFSELNCLFSLFLFLCVFCLFLFFRFFFLFYFFSLSWSRNHYVAQISLKFPTACLSTFDSWDFSHIYFSYYGDRIPNKIKSNLTKGELFQLAVLGHSPPNQECVAGRKSINQLVMVLRLIVGSWAQAVLLPQMR